MNPNHPSGSDRDTSKANRTDRGHLVTHACSGICNNLVLSFTELGPKLLELPGVDYRIAGYFMWIYASAGRKLDFENVFLPI